MVWDASGRPVAQVGDVAPNRPSVQAAADVAGGSWRLEVSQPAANHLFSYLLQGGMIWFFSLVAIALVIASFRVLRTTVSELKHVGTFLHQIGTGPFAIDPPGCEIKETAALLPAIQRIAADLHKKQEAITELGVTDNVTKLPNRLYFFERFRHAFELSKRGSDICLLILEINDFQKASDILGHECVEVILRMLADTLRNQTRKSDFAACLGTSSFVAIFYNTKGDLMCHRLEQLQQDFAARQKKSTATAGEVCCTLSCAMTYVDPENDERPEDTVSRADSAVRNAKKVGGNQIAIIPRMRDDNGKWLAVARK